ncbi:MAG: (2Fe-2S) ferredoxin domain-containing protein [Clostridiales bacterium]|nr:(2Fe-2S) ferredoxin domain-containing protein [Clostridiales bacterium]
MKTLEELKAIREKTLEQVRLRKDHDGKHARIVVGMATCGIAAGARPVMMSFLEELKKRGMENVTVTQTGCVGMCTYEPMADVYLPGEEKVTYVELTPEKVNRIVVEHLANGKPVVEFSIGARQAKKDEE